MSWRCGIMTTDSDSQFLRTVRDGNLEEVKHFLDNGQNINATNINGMSGLHLAAKAGHIEVMIELLNRGANFSARTRKDNTPLHVAALARQAGIIRLLLDRGADVNAVSETGFTPLYLAAQENGADIANMLLQAGADQRIHTVDGFSPLAVAVQQENAEVINVLLPNWRKTAADFALRLVAAQGQECSDIFKQTADGNVIGVRKALRNSADVNQTLKDGLSPLHLAVVLGDLQMVKELISHGALPNTVSEKMSSPLVTACHICRRDIIQALLEVGADPNIKPRPYDPLLPLHVACNYGDSASVLMLLQHGADVKVAGKWMSMNSRVAFDERHMEVVSLLVRWALCLYPEKPNRIDQERDCGDVVQAASAADEHDPDPTAVCLAMMGPIFRSRPQQVDVLVQDALANTHKVPIFKAAEEGNVELAAACYLQSAGCVNARTSNGLTPLHIACLRGHVAVVSFLVEKKADINAASDKGLTPAILAAYSNQPLILQLLLKAGIDVSQSMQNGLTPLGMAIAKQNLASAEAILKLQPLAPPCSILNILSTQQEEKQLSQVLNMVEWACRSNPLASGQHRKKGRRACVVV